MTLNKSTAPFLGNTISEIVFVVFDTSIILNNGIVEDSDKT